MRCLCRAGGASLTRALGTLSPPPGRGQTRGEASSHGMAAAISHRPRLGEERDGVRGGRRDASQPQSREQAQPVHCSICVCIAFVIACRISKKGVRDRAPFSSAARVPFVSLNWSGGRPRADSSSHESGVATVAPALCPRRIGGDGGLAPFVSQVIEVNLSGPLRLARRVAM